jgi:hypothetical protein
VIPDFPIKRNIGEVLGRIGAALARAGRQSEAVTLVAVTKNVPAARILEAREAGLAQFGENRIQEARQKIPVLPGDLRWHMIGHLQSNKVKDAVSLFDMIQSVDSAELASEVARRAVLLGRTAKVLVQVNTSGEKTKHGVEPDGVQQLLDRIETLEGIEVSGLMTIGPLTGNTGEIRASFARLRRIFEEISAMAYRRSRMDLLSMGMTDDFEIALEEGSNMLRIGRAIFGERTVSQEESAR